MKPWMAALLLVWGATARAFAGSQVFTNTSYVEDVRLVGDELWTATRGGVERYRLVTGERRLYTTQDGLSENGAVSIRETVGEIEIETATSSCRLQGADRFACVPSAPRPLPEPSVSSTYQGARVTRVIEGPRRVVATAGAGVFIDEQRLTPDDQVCSNHVVAMTKHDGQLWLGSFDEGVCVYDGKAFRRLTTPFRMVNDLASTPAGLYVAASEGLFLSQDGATFTRVLAVDARGVNDLAFDGKNLYATTAAALWRLRLPAPFAAAAAPTRAFFRPGGSRALQAVDVAGDTIWLASEDRGAIRIDNKGAAEVFDRARGMPSSWAVDIAAGPDGSAYVATLRNGVVRLARDGTPSPVAGLPDPWVLFVSYGQLTRELWVGTQGGGATVVAGAEAPRGTSPLPDANVHAVFTDGPDVWIATEGGLARLGGA